MLIENLLDVDVLREHVQSGVVNETPNRFWGHVKIYNYGHKAQFNPELWDDVTEVCRGLIVNWDTGEVLARPFRKFFNLNTSYRPETYTDCLPASDFIATEKLDGSLGILWRYDGEPFVATRGSFSSSPARWATEYFKKNCTDIYPVSHTPLFEVIYPENRIVVKYERHELALLGLVNIEDGSELPYSNGLYAYAQVGSPVVRRFTGKTVSELVSEERPNEEGYVLTWYREKQVPFRVKVKFAEYMRIHRLVTGLSRKAVWEILRTGKTLEEALGDLPDHFKEWANTHTTEIIGKYDAAKRMAEEAWDSKPETDDRKQLAAHFLKYAQPSPAVCFARLDGKNESEILWKSARPRSEDAFKTAVVES